MFILEKLGELLKLNRCLVKLERFTSKINVQGKCVMHLQSCCFANHDYLLLFQCRSRCCRRRRLKLYIVLLYLADVFRWISPLL